MKKLINEVLKLAKEYERKQISLGSIVIHDDGKENFHESISVVKDDDMINPDEKIINEDQIKIMFDYPLSHKVKKEFKSEDGFTRHDLWQTIHDGYTEIYKEEDEVTGDPGMIGETLNRAESHGPHGIWGHVIDDLYIEGIVEKTMNEYGLIMGS